MPAKSESSALIRTAAIKDYGGDGKTIILLHGFLSSSSYWSTLAPLLVQHGYRVIAIDLLGFGAAPKPRDSSYDYAAHLNHVQHGIEQLNIQTPYILVGHSMGALLASAYGRQFPDAVSAVVLLNPPLFQNRQEVQATLRQTGRLYRFLLDNPVRQPVWQLARLLPSMGLAKHTAISRELTLQNVLEAPRILEDLEAITTPTLLINGLQDRPVYRKNLAGITKNNQLTIIDEDTTHHGPTTKPALICQRIVDFLDQRTS